MESPLSNEPQWSMLPDGETSKFLRPLLGSELFFAQFDRLEDGLSEVCMGFNFKTTLPSSALTERARDGISELRYTAPIIAASIVSPDEDPHSLQWLYRADLDPHNLETWLDDSLHVRSRPSDIEDFVAETNQKKLPYVLSNGQTQFFRAYLLLGTDGLHSLFFHGSHAMLDAKPTLNAFYVVLTRMSDVNAPPRSKIEWGGEWRRLAAGPVTATGGPRENWNEEGMALLIKAQEIMQKPTVTHSLHPQRDHILVPGKPVRVHRIIDQDTGSRILTQLKIHGYGVTHLLEAALAMAVLSCHPVEKESVESAHVTFDRAMISNDRFLVPPHNTRSHFVTGLTMFPLHVAVKDLADEDSPKAKLLAVMRILKGQYDGLLQNPHIPHFVPAFTQLFPPRGPTQWVNPHASMMTNFGVVERQLPLKWAAGKPCGEHEGSDIEVVDITFGHRLPFFRTFAHVWTVGSRIHLQVQASDAWDRDVVENYIDEIVRHALLILDDIAQ